MGVKKLIILLNLILMVCLSTQLHAKYDESFFSGHEFVSTSGDQSLTFYQDGTFEGRVLSWTKIEEISDAFWMVEPNNEKEVSIYYKTNKKCVYEVSSKRDFFWFEKKTVASVNSGCRDLLTRKVVINENK